MIAGEFKNKDSVEEKKKEVVTKNGDSENCYSRAGYGGLVTALRLQKGLHYNEANITLVNKHGYHYITTELHQPAAGTCIMIRLRIDIRRIN